MDIASESSLTPNGMRHACESVCCRLVEVVDGMPYVAEAPEGMRHMLKVFGSMRDVVEVAEDIRHVVTAWPLHQKGSHAKSTSISLRWLTLIN